DAGGERRDERVRDELKRDGRTLADEPRGLLAARKRLAEIALQRAPEPLGIAPPRRTVETERALERGDLCRARVGTEQLSRRAAGQQIDDDEHEQAHTEQHGQRRRRPAHDEQADGAAATASRRPPHADSALDALAHSSTRRTSCHRTPVWTRSGGIGVVSPGPSSAPVVSCAGAYASRNGA